MTSIIKSLQQEVLALIEVQKELLIEVKGIKHLWSDTPSDGILTPTKIDDFIKILDGEAQKAQRLEAVVAVVGTMKAGKSTTINALVGEEILPNRELAMTTLPTLIRHTPNQKEPTLTISKLKPIQTLCDRASEKISQLLDSDREKLLNDKNTQPELFRKIEVKELQFQSEYKGKTAIQSVLKDINDLFRLAKSHLLDLDVDSFIAEYDDFNNLPVIEIEFTHLSKYTQLKTGTLSLLDTPGPNEAGQGETLRQRLTEQLKRASMVLCVMDYSKLNSMDDESVRTQIAELKTIFENRLYIAVNKYDQHTSNCMDEGSVKKYAARLIADSLEIDSFEEKLVFPISSLPALLATRIERELSIHEHLPNPFEIGNGWVNDFGEKAFATEWEDMRDDIVAIDKKRLEKAYARLLKSSLYPNLINAMLENAFSKAGLTCLESALSKLSIYASELDKYLEIGSVSLTKNIDELHKTIQQIEKAGNAINSKQTEAKNNLNNELLAYQVKVDSLVETAKNHALLTLKQMLSTEQEQLSAGYQAQILEINKELSDLHDKKIIGLNIGRKNHREEKFLSKKLREMKLNRPNFDVNNPIVDFGTNKSEAEKFKNELLEQVKRVFITFNDDMLKSLHECDEQTKKALEITIQNGIAQIGANLQEQLHKDGYDFSAEVLPPFSLTPPKHSFDSIETNRQLLEKTSTQKDETTKVRIKREGFWHGFFKIVTLGIRDDYEEKSQTVQVTIDNYAVNKQKFEQLAISSLDKTSGEWKSNTTAQFANELLPLIEQQFEKIQQSVESLITEFESSKRRTQLDITSKKYISEALTVKKHQNRTLLSRMGVASNGLTDLSKEHEND